jgi:hypothetical protein
MFEFKYFIIIIGLTFIWMLLNWCIFCWLFRKVHLTKLFIAIIVSHVIAACFYGIMFLVFLLVNKYWGEIFGFEIYSKIIPSFLISALLTGIVIIRKYYSLGDKWQ